MPKQSTNVSCKLNLNLLLNALLLGSVVVGF